jgi:hypothetical protein
MEHPDDQLIEEEDPTIKNTLASFILKQHERSINRDISDDLYTPENPIPAVEKPTEATGTTGETLKSNKYVPPSARGTGAAPAGSAMSTSNPSSSSTDENTIRISNLSKNTTEEDLRELCGRFGTIARLFLPRMEKTENGKTFKEPKGFAFVAYLNRKSAEEALERLNGHGYDHLILSVEWSKKDFNNPGSSGGLSGGYVSGYGKQLAQDTKEKVSYASNLTGNTN